MYTIAYGMLHAFWCAKRDLNPHTSRHGLLRPACLPFHHSRELVGVARIELAINAPKALVLPLHYTPNLVARVGIEPTTNAS